MTSLEMRLQEATAILETLRDQRVLLQADLWHWEQELQTALSEAHKRDQDELQSRITAEHDYQTMLQQWMFQQSEEARVALDRRKRLGHRIFILMVCICSGGIILILELREILALQSQRDNPRFGEEQRLWSRKIQDAQRDITYLRSLLMPRATPGLRECNQELFSLRKKLDTLDSQILPQEARVQVLQQQLASHP